MIFDHIGLVTDEKKDNEDWVEATKVWVTNPKNHPFHVEWLRYEPESPAPKQLKESSHIAYQVEDIESAAKNLNVLLEPFEVGGFVKVGFYEYKDGSVIELMQYLKDKSEWFHKKS